MSEILALLTPHADPASAPEKAAYHKTAREVLGVPNPVVNDVVATWRKDRPLADWLVEADLLWRSGVFEARVAAGKLLTKARMGDQDAPAWAMIQGWVPDFDGWAIADHAAKAGERRVMADLSRMAVLDGWSRDDALWTRRAAFVFSLPLAKLPHPSASQAEARAMVIGWAERLADDPAWFIQKAIAWWMRTLARHDPSAVRRFLDDHGPRLKAFARREAARGLPAGM